MAGWWFFVESGRRRHIPLRTTPPGPTRRSVTAAQERWDEWAERGDRVSLRGRRQAQLALAGAMAVAALYVWLV